MKITINDQSVELDLSDEQVEQIKKQINQNVPVFRESFKEKPYFDAEKHRDYMYVDHANEIINWCCGGYDAADDANDNNVNKFDYCIGLDNCYDTKDTEGIENHQKYLQALSRVRKYIYDNHHFKDYGVNEIGYSELCIHKGKWNKKYIYSDHYYPSIFQPLDSDEDAEAVIKNCAEDLEVIRQYYINKYK